PRRPVFLPGPSTTTPTGGRKGPMRERPLVVCNVSGCPTLIPQGTDKGRCREHLREVYREASRRERANPNSAKSRRGNTWKQAERARAQLKRDPWCAVDGCRRIAEQADHVV